MIINIQQYWSTCYNEEPVCDNELGSQCGGEGFQGDTCCPVSAEQDGVDSYCAVVNASYSSCQSYTTETCPNEEFDRCFADHYYKPKCCGPDMTCNKGPQSTWYCERTQCTEEQIGGRKVGDPCGVIGLGKDEDGCCPENSHCLPTYDNPNLSNKTYSCQLDTCPENLPDGSTLCQVTADNNNTCCAHGSECRYKHEGWSHCSQCLHFAGLNEECHASESFKCCSEDLECNEKAFNVTENRRVYRCDRICPGIQNCVKATNQERCECDECIKSMVPFFDSNTNTSSCVCEEGYEKLVENEVCTLILSNKSNGVDWYIIVGGVLGGLAVLGLICGIGFYYWYKKMKKMKGDNFDQMSQENINKFLQKENLGDGEIILQSDDEYMKTGNIVYDGKSAIVDLDKDIEDKKDNFASNNDNDYNYNTKKTNDKNSEYLESEVMPDNDNINGYHNLDFNEKNDEKNDEYLNTEYLNTEVITENQSVENQSVEYLATEVVTENQSVEYLATEVVTENQS
eukprot:Pgem_evm1s9459